MICLGNYSHTFGVIMICSRLKEWRDKKNQIIPVAILPLLLGTVKYPKAIRQWAVQCLHWIIILQQYAF